MNRFDYLAPAELFIGKNRISARGSPVRYLRFSTSAEAIKHAVEALAPKASLSASLVVGDDHYNAPEIRALYDGKGFPLERRRI